MGDLTYFKTRRPLKSRAVIYNNSLHLEEFFQKTDY
jgi:hypothetical protein